MKEYLDFDYDDANFRDRVLKRMSDAKQDFEDNILLYLKSGVEEYSYKHTVRDIVSGNQNNSSRVGYVTFTDGSWRWDNSLIYHIEKYHYKISDEFLCHMKKNNWTISQEIKDKVLAAQEAREIDTMKNYDVEKLIKQAQDQILKNTSEKGQDITSKDVKNYWGEM